MSQRAKLIAAVRNNPNDVRFDDACKIARWLGFVHEGRGKGPHRAFSRTGEATLLNFQNRGGRIPRYQADQLIEMIDKYESEL